MLVKIAGAIEVSGKCSGKTIVVLMDGSAQGLYFICTSHLKRLLRLMGLAS